MPEPAPQCLGEFDPGDQPVVQPAMLARELPGRGSMGGAEATPGNSLYECLAQERDEVWLIRLSPILPQPWIQLDPWAQLVAGCPAKLFPRVMYTQFQLG